VKKFGRKVGSVALGAAAVAVLASCSGGTPSDEYLSGDLAAQIQQRIDTLDYPSGQGALAELEEANLQTQLIHDCVVAEGLKVPPPNLVDPDQGFIAPDNSTIWLTAGSDFGVARQLQDPGVAAYLRKASSQDARSGSSVYPTNYDDVVYGADSDWITIQDPHDDGSTQVSIGGCFGKATEEMYGVPAETYQRAYYEKPWSNQVLDAAIATKAVRSAAGHWSDCMNDHGYATKDPADMGKYMSRWVEGSLDGSKSIDKITADEHKLAAADKDCKTSSGLGTAVDKAFIAEADKVIKGKEGVITEYRKMVDHALALAKKENLTP
jgi:hypothetical protein